MNKKYLVVWKKLIATMIVKQQKKIALADLENIRVAMAHLDADVMMFVMVVQQKIVQVFVVVKPQRKNA